MPGRNSLKGKRARNKVRRRVRNRKVERDASSNPRPGPPSPKADRPEKSKEELE
jgi:hypothetical protein